MTYTPVAYTDLTTVKRLLRTQNDKIRIGDNENDTISPADVQAYIMDASKLIDGMLRQAVNPIRIPLVVANYPLLQYAAPRLSAFLIYRDLFQGYRQEQVPAGPRGWFDEFNKTLEKFIKDIEMGLYPDLSSSTNGMGWITAQQFLINRFGVASVDADLIYTRTDQVPCDQDYNAGPNGQDH
jgi:hypothetical protein